MSYAAVVDRIVEGWYWSEPLGTFVESGRQWVNVRSRVEETGEVGSDDHLEMIDVDRAITQLRFAGRSFPRARMAAVMALLTRDGMDSTEISEAFRGMRVSPGRSLDDAKRFLTRYLNGEEPWEAAKDVFGRQARAQS